MITPVWYRGETIEYVLTVTSDGDGDDLRLAAGIELQVKLQPGAVDPPLVSVAIGTGVTLRDQDATPGIADVVIPYNALTGPGTPAGTYWFDVCMILPGPVRRYVVKPTKVVIRDVVNQP